MTLRERLFGDRAFYKMVIAIALPILVQNGVTNFVNLLDNIMVGRLGTDPMSGVAIVNQLMFVFNVSIFGGVSGAGIFGAQFFGKRDFVGLQNTLRFKLLCCGVLAAGFAALFLCCGDTLVSFFLHEGSETGDAAATLSYARDYLRVAVWGLFPFALKEAYASTLRETGRTVVPMNASTLALFVNLIFNYLFIFGKLGFPALGVRGAALATVMARCAECAVVVGWTHRNPDRCPFGVGLYKTMRLPGTLARDILRRGTPLMCNEIIWSLGMTILAQCYSMRGLAVVAGNNIASTVVNLFNITFLSIGTSISIVVGNLLGASKMEEARRADTRMIAFSVLVCIGFASIMVLLAPLFPRIYNTTDEVRAIARDLIRITAGVLPMHAFLHATYFTLRSGGKTLLTFFFDSGFVWVICIPLAFFLSRYTDLPIRPMYAIVQYSEIIKVVIGYLLLRSDIWVNNIVNDA